MIQHCELGLNCDGNDEDCDEKEREKVATRWLPARVRPRLRPMRAPSRRRATLRSRRASPS